MTTRLPITLFPYFGIAVWPREPRCVNLPNEEPAVAQAYGRFLMQFETVVGVGGGRDAQ